MINNLNRDLSDNIVLRYLKYVENEVQYKFQENIFNKKINYDHGNVPFEKITPNGKLFIHTMNSTSFLETMYYNIPTLLLLDKKCETFNKSSQKLVKLLEKEKIIHYDANLASKFVNKNFNNIEEWWFNKSLQSARRKFCSVFVRQANNPTNELKSIFAELSKWK